MFHEIRVQADSWGGDPYNTVRVDAKKTDIYRLHASYSNIMYFNFLPSFANPQAGQGVLVDQRSYDDLNRNSNASLDLFPGKRIIPFFAYDRSSGSGTGITPIVFDNNEFPIGNEISWQSNDFRARNPLRIQQMADFGANRAAQPSKTTRTLITRVSATVTAATPFLASICL